MKNYEILSLISSSQVSRIYKGLNRKTERTVAIKELLVDITLSEKDVKELIKQFHLEVGLFMKFNHPGLPRIYDHFEDKGSRYLVMDFIDGKSLYELVNNRPDFPEEKELLSWSLSLCSILNYLHSMKPRPIIFRNLKPENIFIDKSGNIKLFGFGLSKIFVPGVKTMSVVKVGNPHFSSPEQYRGITDITSDIYSLGATLYYLSTKVFPEDSLDRIMNDKELKPCNYYNSALSSDFSHLISKAMKINKLERFKTTEEIAGDLKKIQKNKSFSSSGLSSGNKISSPAVSHNLESSSLDRPSGFKSPSFRINLPPKKFCKHKTPVRDVPAGEKKEVKRIERFSEKKVGKERRKEPLKGRGKRIDLKKLQEKKRELDPEANVSSNIRKLRSSSEKIKDKSGIPPLAENTLLKGRYEVIELISASELSKMYRGLDLKKNCYIAIKELLAFMYLKEKEKNRDIKAFHAETESLLHLRHPNIPQFIDYFEEEKRHYLIMEFIEGETLQVYCKGRPLPVEEVILWTFQLSSVLSYLHNMKPRPVIFRGLCPKNIILNRTGRVKLIDFGLSKLFDPKERTLSISKIANTYFSPPEQYIGKTDNRSDIYALGATIYYLLTGVLPPDSVDRTLEKTPLIPCRQWNENIPVEVERIIMRATKVNKNDRFQNIEDIERRLEDLFPYYREKIRKLNNPHFFSI